MVMKKNRTLGTFLRSRVLLLRRTLEVIQPSPLMAAEDTEPQREKGPLQVPQGSLQCPSWPPSCSKATPTTGSPSPKMSKLVETLDNTLGNSLMFQIRKLRPKRFVLPKVKYPSVPCVLLGA